MVSNRNLSFFQGFIFRCKLAVSFREGIWTFLIMKDNMLCVFATDASLGSLHIQVICMSLLTSNKFDSFDRFGGRKIRMFVWQKWFSRIGDEHQISACWDQVGPSGMVLVCFLNKSARDPEPASLRMGVHGFPTYGLVPAFSEVNFFQTTPKILNPHWERGLRTRHVSCV